MAITSKAYLSQSCHQLPRSEGWQNLDCWTCGTQVKPEPQQSRYCWPQECPLAGRADSKWHATKEPGPHRSTARCKILLGADLQKAFWGDSEQTVNREVQVRCYCAVLCVCRASINSYNSQEQLSTAYPLPSLLEVGDEPALFLATETVRRALSRFTLTELQRARITCRTEDVTSRLR